jgi:hypothetical protein
MKKLVRVGAGLFLCVCFGAILALFVPFVSFGGPTNEEVVAAAIEIYDLDADKYEISFQDKITNKQGEHVQGLYRVSAENDKEKIIIKNSISRPMMIATIFHEFAHAAQRAHNLNMGKLNIEQHAEALSFQKMWNSGYRYYSLHLITLHVLGGKPEEYRAPAQLLQISCGTNLMLDLSL